MKKYRLIEYDPNQTQKIWPCGIWDSKEEALGVMFEEQEKNQKGCFYRIEEFEDSIMDRVKCYEDACEVLGIDPIVNTIMGFYTAHNGSRAEYVGKVPNHIITLLKLETITAALNEGWKPNWEDRGQERWRPNLIIEDGLLQGHVYPVVMDIDFPVWPLRLYFKSRELAKYAASQFVDLYKQLLT